MKLQDNTANVIRSGTGTETEFGFEYGRKAFRTFSDSIYTNKIGSICREISSNAYDSHVRAGCPELPFIVHLPDEVEPWFSVKDFGVGMSDYEVRYVFATYMKSTKDDKANEIGAYGLGAKTPFAYTDAFTIIAIKDGVRNQYSAFINDNGKPAIVDLSSQETDEPNGVEIMIPVTEVADFERFKEELINQLRFFTVKPEVVNGYVDFVDFRSNTTDYLACKDIAVGSDGSPLRGVWVVQGVVGYPLNLRDIKARLSPENAEFLDLISASAIIYMDLGDIEVTASREAISITEYTVAGISRKLDATRVNIRGEVQKHVDEANTSPWNLACKLEINHNFRKLAKLAGAEYKGLPVTFTRSHDYRLSVNLRKLATCGDDVVVEDTESDEIPSDNEDDIDGMGLTPAETLIFKQTARFRTATYTGKRKRRGSKYHWNRASAEAATLQPNNNVKVLVLDECDKPQSRLNNYFDSLNLAMYREVVYVIEMREHGERVSDDDIKLITEMLGGHAPIRISSLPKPIASRGRVQGQVVTGFRMGEDDNVFNCEHWDRLYVSLRKLKTGGYIVPMDRNNVKELSSLHMIRAFHEANLLDKPVYALRWSEYHKYLEVPGFERASDKDKAIVEAFHGNRTLVNGYAAMKILEGMGGMPYPKYFNEVLFNAAQAGLIPRHSAINRQFRLAEVLAKIVARAEKRGLDELALKAFNYAGSDFLPEVLAMKEAVARISQQAREDYPLLTNLTGGHFQPVDERMARHMIDYVNAVTPQ